MTTLSRLTPFAIAVLFTLPFARSARAEPPNDDVLTPLDAREVRRDVRITSYDEPGDASPLWLSVVGGLSSTQAGYEGTAILSLGGAMDRFARRPPAPSRAKEIEEPRSTARDAAPRSDAAHARSARKDAPLGAGNETRPSEEPPPPPERAPTPPKNDPPPVEPRIDGAFARGLVRAVRARAKERDSDERLDGLATRARASALLPEVRVRVARVTSGTQALSPTEYDPTRVTTSDGSGLWLEGRATFRLDRLVFADDEIAIERIRAERDRMDRAIVAEALAALALYQRGAARAADPTLADDDRVTGEITALSAAATLDVLSDGWFSAHLPKTD